VIRRRRRRRAESSTPDLLGLFGASPVEVSPEWRPVGTCSECESPVMLRSQGEALEASCSCGRFEIPDAFFFRGRER
jgi:hypothetical protein